MVGLVLMLVVWVGLALVLRVGGGGEFSKWLGEVDDADDGDRVRRSPVARCWP